LNPEKHSVPLFFDLSSLFPTVARNPFQPVVVADELPAELGEEEIPAEPFVDTGLPIPGHYEMDVMGALVQDPFHIFVYWQLRQDPFTHLQKIFSNGNLSDFDTVLKLIDVTHNISVYFNAAFARDYWFDVFPDRLYRVELGVRSPRFGFIRLLSSRAILTPRGRPSDQAAEEPAYEIGAEEYVRILRESHLVPERAFTPEGLFGTPPGLTAEAAAEVRQQLWSTFPHSFRRLIEVIAAIQAGRDYEKLWEILDREELASMVREFLDVIAKMGGGETGYMLLLRYLPELLRRAIAEEGQIEVDKPMTLYLAERLGQSASEMNVGNAGEGDQAPGKWLPSLTS
jgi:hypothetical protein